MSTWASFRAAKGSRVTVEDTTLLKSKWDTDLHGDDIDVTNFESEGVDEGITGIVGADWHIGGLWNGIANELDEPPGLWPRDNLGAVQLFTNVVDNVFWNYPYNRVLSSKNGAEVKGGVSFESSGKLNGGPFDLPGGTTWLDGMTGAPE